MNDETRIVLLEHTITHIDESLKEIKQDLRTYKQEFNIKFDNIDSKLSKIDIDIQTNFKWIMGVIITLFSGLYATALGGMVARLCKWI